MKPRTFEAKGLRGLVILLPGKAVRHCTGWPPTTTVFVVAGSKICPLKICDLSQGFINPVSAPSSAEKSPVRSASADKEVMIDVPTLFRYCSQEQKQELLSWPLYSVRIHHGP